MDVDLEPYCSRLQEPKMTVDIDSVLYHDRALPVNDDICWRVHSNMEKNIQANIHVEVKIGETSYRFHELPNMVIGKMASSEYSKIYIVFPWIRLKVSVIFNQR